MDLTFIFISVFLMLLVILVFIFTSVSTMHEIPKTFFNKEDYNKEKKSKNK